MKTLSLRCRAAAVLGVCVAAFAVQAPAAFAADTVVNLTTSRTFSPSTIAVSTGDTVTWTWTESRSHNVTATSGQADTWASANKSSGTYVRTFSVAGSFTYSCTLHGGMNGTVTVSSGTPPPPPPPPADTTPPGAPSGLVATAADSRVTVDWANSTASDFDHYVVQRRIGAGAWTAIASPTTSVHADTTAVNGTTYSYRVMAVDLTGNTSTASATVSGTPAAPPPVVGPVTRRVDVANYQFAPAAITIKTGDTVAFDWSGTDLNHSVTSLTGADTYDSHLGLTDGQITGAPVAGFSHTYTQVGAYTYVCRVHTDMTGTVNVTTAPATPDTTAPSAPATPVVTAADARVTVDWADSSAPDLNNYVVQRRVGTGAWATVASPIASVYVDTAVINGTAYSYRVSAVDATGNVSVASTVVAATPVPAPVAPPVTGPVTRHVSIAGYLYLPASLTVNSGDTVEWDWTGSDVNHSVTSVGGLLESFESHLGALVSAILAPPPGGAYSHTFRDVGTYSYLCRVHPDMTGSVQVVSSGAPDTQPVTPPASAPVPTAPAQDVKPARTAKTYGVKVADFAYTPANLAIRTGDAVKWSWTAADVNHSVTATNGQAESFESHPGLKTSEVLKAPEGGSFTHVFAKQGRFTYLCRVHPGMTASVTVSQAPLPARVRIVKVTRGTGSLRVSYRLTKPASLKAYVYKSAKRIVTKTTRGSSGANSLRIVLPRSARRAALKVVMRPADGGAQARATVRAVRR